MAATKKQVVVQQTNPIAVFSPFELQLQKFEADIGSRVYNLDDAEQLKLAKSDRMAVSKSITALEDARKTAKKDAQAIVDAIDDTGKKIRDRLEALRDKVWNPIKEFEAREERVQAAIDALRKIPDQIPAGADSATLKEALMKANSIEIAEQVYIDRVDEAKKILSEAISKVTELLKQRAQYEADQAELAELRKAREKAEQEERNRLEVEVATRKERERLEQERAQLAEQERRKAEDVIRIEQEKARAAEQRAQESAAAERKRIEDEQRKKAEEDAAAEAAENERKAKVEHRAKIHREAKESLLMYLIEKDIKVDSDTATAIITGIKDGKVDHVTINY